MVSSVATIIIIGLALVAIGWLIIRLLSRSYVKTTATTAFVRTGGLRGGRAARPTVVMNGAAWVFGFLHRIKWVSLETLAIEIRHLEDNALITSDPQYVDLEARFFVKIKSDAESVSIAARTIGGEMVNEASVRRLVEPKINGAVRDVAVTFTLRGILEKRMDFIRQVQDRLKDDLAENGLVLETVSILIMRPTLKGQISTDDILGAQVARFAGADWGALDVEMHAQVPVLFAGADADSLDVALVLLGEGGSTLSVTRGRVPAQEGSVSLEASTHASIRGVVAELYSPATGQAAALRRAIEPLATASDVTLSDVVLTAAASPGAADVARGAAWIEPLALDNPVRSHAIGAYFELYGAPAASSWYRLRAELQDRATGDVRDLPIQPAGEGGFRSTWDRRPVQGDLTAEFISIWIGDVPPGRYVLRVVADVPGAGSPLSAEQALDRR